MKNLFNNLVFLVFLILINISIVKAATNPYNETGPYGINCTWYAWKMAQEKAGVALPGFGNAKDWYNNASKAGYTVGSEPKANSIIVWGGWTSYGHVGYVESVEGNILHVWDSSMSCIDREDAQFQECMANGVSEESDKICYANAKRIACEYTILPDEFGITGYIYLDFEPKLSDQVNSETNDTVTKKEEASNKSNADTKSSNANLNNIEVSSGKINYDKEVLEYSIEVENDVETFSISATPNDEKATVNGTGEYKLNVGLNEIKLVVTAEDKTTKEFIVKVTRKEKINFEVDSEINDKLEDKTLIKNDNKQPIVIVISGLFIIFLVIVLVFIIKKIRLKNIKKQKI